MRREAERITERFRDTKHTGNPMRLNLWLAGTEAAAELLGFKPSIADEQYLMLVESVRSAVRVAKNAADRSGVEIHHSFLPPITV